MMNSRNCFTPSKLSKVRRLSSTTEQLGFGTGILSLTSTRRDTLGQGPNRNYSEDGAVADASTVAGSAGSAAGAAALLSSGAAIVTCFLFFLIRLRTVSDGCA